MKKSLAFASSCFLPYLLGSLLLGAGGCLPTEKNPTAVAQRASCTECHPTLSPECRVDTLYATADRGMAHSACYRCHEGSVHLDSSRSAVSDTTIYHDAMVSQDNVLYTRTDSLHANGTLDVNLTNCNLCHSYPPGTKGHLNHVMDQNLRCSECHYATIAEDSLIIQGPLFEDVKFFMRRRAVPGGDSVPVPNPITHRDGKRTIVFRTNVREPARAEGPRPFSWDASSRSCSNIRCHVGNHYERSTWPERAP
jgi:hypothetical protein